MNKFKNDKWAPIHEYSFKFEPLSIKDLQNAADYVNKTITKLPHVSPYEQQVKQWIHNNQKIFGESLKKKITYIEFIVKVRNYICSLTKEPIKTPQEIYKIYDVRF